jgi:sterol 14-demethylase
MDMTSSAMWFTVALVFIILVLKIIGRKIGVAPTSGKPAPPVVNLLALLRLLPSLRKKDLPSQINFLYNKYGSVFTVSIFGCNITLLIGPEVSAHFFQGLDSDISHGNLLEFTVPMFGQEVAYGVDIATRNEQARFYIDAFRQSKLRRHFDPMLQEVEVRSIFMAPQNQQVLSLCVVYPEL